jgi:hypothetical protein
MAILKLTANLVESTSAMGWEHLQMVNIISNNVDLDIEAKSWGSAYLYGDSLRYGGINEHSGDTSYSHGVIWRIREETAS